MSAYSRQLNKWSWWRKPRWQVINERAGGICEICHREPATQVHHLVYPSGRREQARDLLAGDLDHYLAHFPPPANDNAEQAELDLEPP